MNINNIISNSISKQTFNVLKNSKHYEDIMNSLCNTFNYNQIPFLNKLSSIDKEKASYLLYDMYQQSKNLFGSDNGWLYYNSIEMVELVGSNYIKYINIFIEHGVIDKKTKDTDISYKKMNLYKFMLIPNADVVKVGSYKLIKSIISREFGGNVPLRMRLALEMLDVNWNISSDEISNLLNTDKEYESYLNKTKDEEPSFEKFLQYIDKQISIINKWNNANAYYRLKQIILKGDTDWRFHWPLTYTHEKLRKYITKNREYFACGIDLGQSQPILISEIIFMIIGVNEWTDHINNGGYVYDLIKCDISDKADKKAYQKKKFFPIPYTDYTNSKKNLERVMKNIFDDYKIIVDGILNITKIKSQKVNDLYKNLPKNIKRTRKQIKKDKDKLKNDIKSVTSTRNFNINGHIIPTDVDSYLRLPQLAQRYESMLMGAIWEALLDRGINFMPLHDAIYVSRSTDIEYVKNLMTEIASSFIKNTKFEFNIEEMK